MKLNFMHGALALGLAALMTACSGSGKPNFETEWFTFTDDEGDAYGFFNPGTGQALYEGEFDGRPTTIVDGIFIVEEQEGKAVYSADGKTPKIIGDLEELKEVGGVAEGMLPVCRKNSRIEVYSVSSSDAKLAFTLDPIDGKEITDCSGRYVEGLICVKNEDGLWGAVDKTGNVVVSLDYADLELPVNGLMIAQKSSDSSADKYFLLNNKGEEIFKFKKDIRPLRVCDNGYIICKNSDNGRYVIANKNEEYINMPKDVNGLYDFYGNYVVYENDNDKYGVLKLKGEEVEVVIRARYRDLTLLPWEPSKFVGSKDGDEYMVMDFDGNKSIDFGDDYESVVPVQTPNWKGFVGITDGSDDECEFYNTKGDKIKFDGIHGIYNIGYRLVYYGIVSSDYFNVDEFARQMSSAIATSGLCGYSMGSPANQYFTYSMEPRNYAYTYWFTPKDEPDVKGYKYSSDIEISAYQRLADGQWSYSTYSYDYYFVRDNPIDGMRLDINGPSNFWDKVGDKITSIIESKGFTVKSENTDEIVYYTPSRDATLTVKWSYSSIKLTYYKVYGY